MRCVFSQAIWIMNKKRNFPQEMHPELAEANKGSEKGEWWSCCHTHLVIYTLRHSCSSLSLPHIFSLHSQFCFSVCLMNTREKNPLLGILSCSKLFLMEMFSLKGYTHITWGKPLFHSFGNIAGAEISISISLLKINVINAFFLVFHKQELVNYYSLRLLAQSGINISPWMHTHEA